LTPKDESRIVVSQTRSGIWKSTVPSKAQSEDEDDLDIMDFIGELHKYKDEIKPDLKSIFGNTDTPTKKNSHSKILPRVKSQKKKKEVKKKTNWPTNPSISHFPKLIKSLAPIKLLLLNPDLQEYFYKQLFKLKKEVIRYIKSESIMYELIDYILCINIWKGEENANILCELATQLLITDIDPILESLSTENSLKKLFSFYEDHHCTLKVVESGKYSNNGIDYRTVPNNIPYFDRVVLHILDRRPAQVVSYLHSRGKPLFNNLFQNYIMYTETAVLFGEIIFQEERMRVKGVALHMPWRGWYIEHDVISKMQQLFINDPEQYGSSFFEFTRILSTFPAQSLSHQFFFPAII